MPTFPQIGVNKILAQLPHTSALSFATAMVDMESGVRWSQPLRGAGWAGYPTRALRRVPLSFAMITDDEVAQIEAFFVQMRGRLGTFTFIDPGGNMVVNSSNLQDPSWAANAVSAVAGIADPFGGEEAWALAGSAAGCYLRTNIVSTDTFDSMPGNFDDTPGNFDEAGGADIQAFRLCASCWMRSASGTVDVAFGFSDSTDNMSAAMYRVCRLSTRWSRFSWSMDWEASGAPKFTIGGAGSWGASTIHVYGPQVSPTLGEGSYVETPTNYAVMPKCRFDADALVVRKIGPNANSVQIPIIEVP